MALGYSHENFKFFIIYRPGVQGLVGFGSVDSDFWIFGVMLISLIRVSLIIESGLVWFLPGLVRIGF